MEGYIVFVKIDEKNRITAVNSSAFVSPDWGTEIDRGNGDKYHHAQGHYFDKPIFEEHGIPVYKLVSSQAVERTQSEIDEDIADIPPEEPTDFERVQAQTLYTAVMTDTLIEEVVI